MATHINSEEERIDKERKRWYKIIEEKSRKCANTTFNCTLPLLDDSDFCMMHILRHPQSDLYKQCAYTYANRRRCINAVKCAAADTVTNTHYLCAQHKATAPADSLMLRAATSESLLLKLGEHLDVPQKDSDDEDIDVESTDIAPPFVSYAHLMELKQVNSDCDSSDIRSLPENVNRMKKSQFLAEDWSDSETESIEDIDLEDYIKHGGVFTQEEVVRASCHNLIRLQNLYKSEIGGLYHKLKQARYRYILDCNKEAASDSSGKHKKKINKEAASSKWPNAMTYDLWLKYRSQRFNICSVLQNRAATRKRSCADLTAKKNKCKFIDDTIKCDNETIVFSDYCRRHILNDASQVLFEACTVPNNKEPCLEAVINYEERAVCMYHRNKLPKQHVTPASGPRAMLTMEQKVEISTSVEKEIKNIYREISHMDTMDTSATEPMDISTTNTAVGFDLGLTQAPLYDMLEEIHANL